MNILFVIMIRLVRIAFVARKSTKKIEATKWREEEWGIKRGVDPNGRFSSAL